MNNSGYGKQAFLIALGAIILSLAIFGSGSKAQQGVTVMQDEIGRFQLLQGKYSIIPPKDNLVTVKEETLFKIDTSTGQVWLYSCKQNKDGEIKGEWILTTDRQDR